MELHPFIMLLDILTQKIPKQVHTHDTFRTTVTTFNFLSSVLNCKVNVDFVSRDGFAFANMTSHYGDTQPFRISFS